MATYSIVCEVVDDGETFPAGYLDFDGVPSKGEYANFPTINAAREFVNRHRQSLHGYRLHFEEQEMLPEIRRKAVTLSSRRIYGRL